MSQLVNLLLSNGQMVTTTMNAAGLGHLHPHQMSTMMIPQQQQHQQPTQTVQTMPQIDHQVTSIQPQQQQVCQMVAVNAAGQVVGFSPGPPAPQPGTLFVSPSGQQPQMMALQPQPQPQMCQVVQHNGQSFAIVQPQMVQQPASQQVVRIPQGQQLIQYTPQSTQLLVNPVTGQIVGQVAPQPVNLGSMQVISTPQPLNTSTITQPQHTQVVHHPAPTATIVQTHQLVQNIQYPNHVSNHNSILSTSEATRLRVQQIILQQQQQILQQKSHKQPTQESKSIRSLTAKKSISPLVSSTTNQPSIKEPSQASEPTKEVISPEPELPEETNIPSEDEDTTNERTSGDIPSVQGNQEENNNEDRTSLSSSPSSRIQEPESTTQSVEQSLSQNTIKSSMSQNVPIIEGVNLEEVKEFAQMFKLKRIRLGMTQTQVGVALSQTQGPSYSQSAICRFEKLEITPKSAMKIMPVLRDWMAEAEKKFNNGELDLADVMGLDNNRKRKRRTSFTPTAVDALTRFFSEVTTHPDSMQMSDLANQLHLDRETVRVWFCNKRQALKNALKKIKNGDVADDFLDQTDSNTSNSQTPTDSMSSGTF